jgi:hypothetical protein
MAEGMKPAYVTDGSGQLIPAASARALYADTVVRPTPTALATSQRPISGAALTDRRQLSEPEPIELVADCWAGRDLRPSGLGKQGLSFPPKCSGSVAGRTMQESTYSPLSPARPLRKDAPHILIVLSDDVDPFRTDTFGSEIHAPTLTRIAREGITYNRLHTTARRLRSE